MFFLKALAASLALVFGIFHISGMFSGEAAIEQIKQAEMADNAREDSGWGPQCDRLRDKFMGVQDGVPVGLMDGNPARSVAKLAAANQKLRQHGCDVDKAPGSFSPFDPESEQRFNVVSDEMDLSAADDKAGGGWGDPNAFNEERSDDWGD